MWYILKEGLKISIVQSRKTKQVNAEKTWPHSLCIDKRWLIEQIQSQHVAQKIEGHQEFQHMLISRGGREYIFYILEVYFRSGPANLTHNGPVGRTVPQIEIVGPRAGVTFLFTKSQWAITCEPQQLGGSIFGTTGFTS